MSLDNVNNQDVSLINFSSSYTYEERAIVGIAIANSAFILLVSWTRHRDHVHKAKEYLHVVPVQTHVTVCRVSLCRDTRLIPVWEVNGVK